MPPQHTHVLPVQNNQPGTGFGSRGRSVGLVLSVTPLGKLPPPRMGARGAIWAHIQILIGKYAGIHQWIIGSVIVWNDMEAISGPLLPVVDSDIPGTELN